MIPFQKVRKYCVYEASQQYKHAVYGGHDLCLCPQVKLPLWYLLPGGDELLHWLLKVLQASEFLLSVCALFLCLHSKTRAMSMFKQQTALAG